MNNLSLQPQTIQQSQGRLPLSARNQAAPSPAEVAKAEETRAAFSEFASKTVFGQLLKSMRQTTGKPAYFHGGRAEEVFRSQLDQVVADQMSETSGADLAEGMFRQQFPQMADVLRRSESPGATHGTAQDSTQTATAGLDQLATLRRR